MSEYEDAKHEERMKKQKWDVLLILGAWLVMIFAAGVAARAGWLLSGWLFR